MLLSAAFPPAIFLYVIEAVVGISLTSITKSIFYSHRTAARCWGMLARLMYLLGRALFRQPSVRHVDKVGFQASRHGPQKADLTKDTTF